MTNKRPLQIDDLLQVEYLSSPALSPCGKMALYVVSTGDRNTGTFIRKIWKADPSGMSKAKALFEGDFQQMLPRFSPDGKTVYFLSDEGNPGVFQIWALKDGKRKKLTHLRHGISWFSVAENGKALAFEAPLWMEGTAPGDKEDNALEELSGVSRVDWQKAKDRAPIHITEVMYKFDETYGIPDGSLSQIGVVFTESGEEKLLTYENVHHRKPVFSPDGEKIACWRYPHGGWKKNRGEISVYTLDGAREDRTENIIGLDEMPVWMEDGSVLYSGYYMSDTDFHGAFYKTGSEKDKPVSVAFDEKVCWGPGAMVTGHTAYGYPSDPAKRVGGKLLFESIHCGSTGVYSLDLENGETKLLTGERVCVNGFDVAERKVLCVEGNPEHIADLYLYDETGEKRLIARHNSWMEEVALPKAEEVLVPSPDGKSKIHGWILKPAGFEEGKKYPAVLDIHGGPECVYPFDWWFEFFYLSARGMAVIWCDPHGSISYGSDYQEGAWDDIAYEDLMAFTDYAVSLGFIDEARIGVTGGSYGGYMTNHIIGRTGRFAAAVSQRNLCNRATSYGTGDMGSILETPFRGCYTSLMNRMKGGSTTIKSIDKITTPLLILHATNDYRCSFEQGEQMFIAMKDRRPDIPVRFAAFPGENHGLTREGNMYAQKGHLLEMADWFAKYLDSGVKEEA